jgi:hypothetical protein
MIHLFLLLLLIALFPRIVLRAASCAIWAVVLLIVVCLFLDSRPAKEPPQQTRSMIVAHD